MLKWRKAIDGAVEELSRVFFFPALSLVAANREMAGLANGEDLRVLWV